MRRATAIIALFTILPTLALAQPPNPDHERGQCFRARNVSGFEPIKGVRDRIRITVGLRDRYELTLRGCENAELAFYNISLKSIGVSDSICRPEDAELIVPQTGLPPQRCIVTDIRQVPPAERPARR